MGLGLVEAAGVRLRVGVAEEGEEVESAMGFVGLPGWGGTRRSSGRSVGGQGRGPLNRRGSE